MPNKPVDGAKTVTVEKFEDALLWKVDEMRAELGMNRTFTLQHLVWRGLQSMGHVKAAVRAEYAEALRATEAADRGSR